MCKEKFEGKGEYYRNEFPINITVNEGFRQYFYEIKLEDICKKCRDGLVAIINSKVQEIVYNL